LRKSEIRGRGAKKASLRVKMSYRQQGAAQQRRADARAQRVGAAQKRTRIEWIGPRWPTLVTGVRQGPAVLGRAPVRAAATF